MLSLHVRNTGWLAFIFASACVDGSKPAEEETARAPLTVTVAVNTDRVLARVPPNGFGIHTSVYDNALLDPRVPGALETAGITMLRYPGGGYSDNYHWSTHSMTPWADGNRGYLAARSDFGSYLELVFASQSALMITVNYGSNLAGDGPGQPEEAAAWVAYANGDPDDDTVIGVDSTGEDWQTVGYWASLRAADKLDDDDGKNFLRIGRTEPVGIEYWEIGNEVFGNGYYASGSDVGFELDLHVPYDGTTRLHHPDLSGESYGEGVAEFSKAMKAVDPSIKIGAVLITPPDDYSWAPTWNDDVLGACASDIDFGIVHWYPNRDDLLNAPHRTLPVMFDELNAVFERHAGNGAGDIEITVTELGTAPGASQEQVSLGGLFAGDSYLTFIEQGATNVAWLELHNGSFLSERSTRRGRAYQGIGLAHLVADVGESLVQTESSHDRSVVSHAGVGENGSVRVMLLNSAEYRDAEVEVTGLGTAIEGDVYRYDPSGEAPFPSDSLEAPAEPAEVVSIDEGAATITLPWRTMAVVVTDPR